MITIAYTTDIVKFYLISSMSGLRYFLSYLTSCNTIMHVSINEACEKRNILEILKNYSYIFLIVGNHPHKLTFFEIHRKFHHIGL